MRCTKCQSRLVRANEDNDLECHSCGKIIYTREPLRLGIIKGRKPRGQWISCIYCGIPVYFRRYQIKKGRCRYCLRCFRKIVLPRLAKLPRRRRKIIEKVKGLDKSQE